MTTLSEAIAACPDTRDAFVDAFSDAVKAQQNLEGALEALAEGTGWDAVFGALSIVGGTLIALVSCPFPEPTVSKAACGGSVLMVIGGTGALVADEVGDRAAAGQAISTAELLRDEAMEDVQAAQESFFKCVKQKLRERDTD